MDLKRAPQHGNVIIVDHVTFRDTPQLVAVVVLIDYQDLPTILIHIKGASFVDVPFALLEGGVDYPHPVKLIAEMIRVDVKGRQNVLVLEGVTVQLVGVIGDVKLLLSDQLPVVTCLGMS